MKHRYYPILLLYFFQAACMPEEDLPIRHTGETPEYFIECYCQPAVRFIGNECASGIRRSANRLFKRNESDHSCRQSHFTDTCFIHSPRFRVYIQLWKPGKI